MASVPHVAELRRAPRDTVSLRARFEGAGAEGSLFLVDLSPLGFMARSQADLSNGDVIRVALPASGMHEARVVWSIAGRVGGEFCAPIAPDAYARMLARAPHDRPDGHDF